MFTRIKSAVVGADRFVKSLLTPDRSARRNKDRRTSLRVEALEAREVPAAMDFRATLVGIQATYLFTDALSAAQQSKSQSLLSSTIVSDMITLYSDAYNQQVNNLAGDIDKTTLDLIAQAVQSPSNNLLANSAVKSDVLGLIADLSFLPAPPSSGSSTSPTGNSSQATQVASVLQSRIWWWDLGSTAAGSTGYVLIFGQQQVSGRPGWYSGTRTIYVNAMNEMTMGFAYQPTANGVTIDYGFSREQITFSNTNLQVGTDDLAFQVTGDTTGSFHWYSTRSSHTPADVRNLYYF
jgi:hypothetical protein